VHGQYERMRQIAGVGLGLGPDCTELKHRDTSANFQSFERFEPD